MPKVRIGVLFAAIAGLLGPVKAAFAGPMDPTPERLVLQPPNAPGGATCQQIAANPNSAFDPGKGVTPNQFACRPDNVAYRNLMSELGFALSPNAFHPARTTGFGGFVLTFETSFTKINTDQVSTAADGSTRQYWHEGTQGPADPNTKASSIINKSPDSLLQVYSLKARKGLGMGFELAGALGYLANTSLWMVGGDIRWSLLEGFRVPNGLGYLPDIAVGGGVRTVSGSSKFYLTTVGVDAQISKPFPLSGGGVLTPFVGYQRLFIFADSTVVDATPNVNAQQQCGAQGAAADGTPICRNKLADGNTPNNSDFNNNITFDKVRVQRHRLNAGLTYRYEVLYLAGQFLTDITNPGDENPGIIGGRQWTMSFEAGLFF